MPHFFFVLGNYRSDKNTAVVPKRYLPNLWIGTSGWTYDDWGAVFYPAGVKGAARLDYYVTQFNAVELNATFYRYPTPKMIQSWNRRIPKGFSLAVKASRRITHVKRLQDCATELTEFFGRIRELHPMQIILWQLPPSFAYDLVGLAKFLERLSRLPMSGIRHAFEFRNTSWWDAGVAHLLQQYQAAFVAVSHPTLPSTIVPTTDFLYIRFHGLGRQLYRYDYSEDELLEWVDRVRDVCRGEHIKDVYAFFNNDFEAHAVQNARVLRSLMLEQLGADDL